MKTLLRRLARRFRGRPVRYDYAEAHRPSNHLDLPVESAMLLPPTDFPGAH